MGNCKHRRIGQACLAVAAIILSSTVSQAAAPRRVHTGTLSCNVSGGIGMIVTSRRALDCVFRSRNRPPERYVGHIQKFGLDIGVTTGGRIAWGVFEVGGHRTDLAGSYAGATAQATFAVGLGANVLVGGSHNSVALQPLSISGQTGLNIAAGVGQITLERAR